MRTEGEHQAAPEDVRYVTGVRLLESVKELSKADAEMLHALQEIGLNLELEARRRGDQRVSQLSMRRWRAAQRERNRRAATAARRANVSNRIVLPPRLFFDGVLRRFMSPGAYDRYIKPVICDMHHEYFECLAKKDERGARWAVIRGHLYVIPSWLLSRLLRLLARVLGKAI